MKVVAVLLAAAVVLLSVQLGLGGWSYGAVKQENPCARKTRPQGGGLDATLQTIVLDGLDGAACKLHTTREKLVLSLSPSSGFRVKWDKQTIASALRAGLLGSIDRAQARGDLPGIVAAVLREVVRFTPIKFLTQGAGALGGLLNRVLG